MAARSWCVGCLLLGGADLAVMNLAVGPRVLDERPLSVEREPSQEPPGDMAPSAPERPTTYAMAASAPALPLRDRGAETASDEPPSRPAGTPALTATPDIPLTTTDTGSRDRDSNPTLTATDTDARSGTMSDNAARKMAVADTAPAIPTLPVVIYFATDRATLWPAAQTRLDEIAAQLADHPGWSLQISGHADARGSDDHNAQLSSRRVRRVREYLEARGVAQARVVGRAFGERVPIAPGADDESLHRNRRVEISFIRSQP